MEWRVPVTDSQSFYVVPTSTDLSTVRATVLHELDCMPCACHTLMQHPLLSNALGHVVVRHPWQWEALMPSPFAHVLGTNARNRLWHSATSLWEAWELSESQIHDCLFPVLDDVQDQVHLQPLSDHADVLADAFQCVQLYNSAGAAKAPHLSVDVAHHARTLLKQHNIVAGVFDKNLTKQYGVCKSLHEMCVASATIFGNRFRIYGFADTWRPAHLSSLYVTVQRACSSGGVRDALSHCVCRQILRDPHLFALWWEELFLQPDAEHKCSVFSPTFFTMLKWKSTEMCTLCPKLKWRDVISFRNNLFSTWGKLIGRSLQRLISFAVCNLATYSFQQLLGVRDQARVVLRLCANTSSKVFLEKDMEDMCWEIPKQDAMAAVRWACSLVKPCANSGSLSFAIAKGQLKHLDRIGTGSSDQFYNISSAAVLRYVQFELFENELFVLGPVILSQGDKGVPIGGFLSAQISELWALWREAQYAFGDQRALVTEQWCTAMRPLLPDLAPALETVELSLIGDTDFTLSPVVAQTMVCRQKIMVHPRIALVSLPALSQSGFDGWWSPMEKLFGCMHMGELNILLVRSTAWDGAPDGRLGAIMRDTLRRDQQVTREMFKDYKQLPCVLAEISQSRCGDPSLFPPVLMILLSKFKDNVYIICMHIPSSLMPVVLEGITQLLQLIYGLRLKWEKHAELVTWGEGKLGTAPDGRMLLYRKSCTLSLAVPISQYEWGTWVDRHSPHCRLVWRSQFPGLLHKCVWYALTHEALQANMRSIMWALGCKGYPQQWWVRVLRRFWGAHALHNVIPLRQMFIWCQQGTLHMQTYHEVGHIH